MTVVIEKVVGRSLDIFDNILKSLESRWECSEILDITSQKPHAFDSEIVGRYKVINIINTRNSFLNSFMSHS